MTNQEQEQEIRKDLFLQKLHFFLVVIKLSKSIPLKLLTYNTVDIKTIQLIDPIIQLEP